MARYLTGKVRTLTATGTMEAHIAAYSERIFDGGGGGPSHSIDRFSSASGSASAFGVGPLTFGSGYTIDELIFSYNDICQGPGESEVRVDLDYPVFDSSSTELQVKDVDDNPTGSWIITVQVREYIEVIETGVPNPKDTPPITAFRVWEEVVPDTEATWEVEWGAASSSGTMSLSGDISYAIGLTGVASAIGLTATINVDCDGYVSAAETSSLATSGGSYSAGGDEVTATAAGEIGMGGVNVVHNATASLSASPPKEYDVDGRVRAMEDAYPDALTVDVTNGGGLTTMGVSGGVFSSNSVQYRYNCSGNVDGTPGTTKSKDEWAPVSFAFDPDSLEAAGEDTDLTRILIRGKAWSAMSISQSSSVTVDDGSDLTPSGAWEGEWTGTGDVSPSVVSGAIQFVSDDGAGTLKREFEDDVSLSGYRYLRIRLRSLDEANQSLPVKIGDKRWSIQTGDADTFVDVDIDLCAEQNESADTSVADTHWPVIWGRGFNTGDRLPEDEQAYFGVGRCAAIEFPPLPEDIVFEIDSITLRRESYSNVSFCQTFKWWTEETPPEEIAEIETDTEYLTSRFLLGDTDGRQSLEVAAARRQIVTNSTTTDTLYHESIKALIAYVNEVTAVGTILNPGWAATDIMPAPASGCSPTPPDRPPAHDCYYNSDRYAVYLWGAGCQIIAGEWSYGFDKSANSSLGVSAQPLYDSVDWYPDCGDVFNVADGEPDGPIHLCPAAILRGQAHGLVLDADHKPANGIDVDVRTSGGDDRGDGDSGSDGAYQTGLEYPRGGESAIVEPQSGSKPNVTITIYSRKRHRAVFVISVRSFGQLAIDSIRQWLHVALPPRIRTYHMGTWSMAFESDDYDIEDWVRLTFDERRGALYMLGTFVDTDPDPDERKHRLFRSFDAGLTGEEVLTVTADSAAVERDSERSVLLVLTQEGSGHIQFRESLDGGENWSSAADIKDDSNAAIDGDVVDMAQDPRYGGAILATFKDGGSASIWISYDLARTWKQIIS